MALVLVFKLNYKKSLYILSPKSNVRHYKRQTLIIRVQSLLSYPLVNYFNKNKAKRLYDTVT